MRIAFVSFEYPPFIIGGAGIYAKNLVGEIAKRGHQVTVFTPRIGCSSSVDQERAENIKVIRVPVAERLPFRALQFWLRLPGIVRKADEKEPFDILHVNGISYWFLKKRLLQIPHVLTIHHLVVDAATASRVSFLERLKNIGGENDLLIPKIERSAVRYVDAIIAVSDYTRSRLLDEFHLIPDRVITIYNGIEPVSSTFTKGQLDRLRERLGLGDDRVVLFVGRVNDPRKGLDILLRALCRVLEEIECKLLVVGSGDQSEMKTLAMERGIQEKIRFLGWVDDSCLRMCYDLCDVYVCPSRLEGFGLTVLEAMAAGKPVVATDAGAIPELIRNGVNGMIVKREDVDALAGSIIELLENDSLRQEMGERGREFAEKYNWGSCAKEVERVYAELN